MAVGPIGEKGGGNEGVTVENCKDGAAVNLGRKTVGTSGDGKVESPRDAWRDTGHVFVSPCDNKGADACHLPEFVVPCDNLDASRDNTGAGIAILVSGSRLVRPTPDGFLSCLFYPGVLLPCATTLSLRVTMRSSMDSHSRWRGGDSARTARALGVYLWAGWRGAEENISPRP